METYDFGGWATRNDLLCGDGRTIRKNAFKDNHGQTVPLIWNHDHSNPEAVLGHALLENKDDGVYAYCKFNDTEQGLAMKKRVEHGDVRSLSIYANQLKQIGKDVIHGCIRELSLVLAGANPGAYIDFVMAHGDDEEDGVYANYDENALVLFHSVDAEKPAEESEKKSEDSEKRSEELSHADSSVKENEEFKKEAKTMPETKKTENTDKTVQEVFDSMTEEQKTVVYALIGQALDDADGEDEDEDEGGKPEMKHNVFDNDTRNEKNVLSHSDQEAILTLAKSNSCGSLKAAMESYAETNDALAHGINEIETLFPEFQDVRPGAPELITDDQTWVTKVINKIHKSPISRIRTRQADARTTAELKAKGYKKGSKKNQMGNISLLSRTTDPQTIYIKDSLNRDDIIDIKDFDVVAYNYGVMQMMLKQEIATSAFFGDGREDGDPDKISETHIRPIWTDDELYTIHAEVDVAKARAELQGTGTSVSFGDNYVYAEAIITAALYAREQYKGSGALDFYCDPHLLNVMLLARDMNGHRMYRNVDDLRAALNVNEIITVEQMAGKTRKVEGGTKKLLGIFVNLNDYQFGATKGGEITKFEQFDIDFNQNKYLIETRLSGALVRIKSAIVLEEPKVTTTPEEDDL